MDIAQKLVEAGTKYKKEILTAPVVAFDELKPHFTIRTGIQGKVVGGILTADAEFRPYQSAKGATDGIKIEPHEWEAFLGDVLKEFDPNVVLGSLYTERTSKSSDQMDIAKKVALRMALKSGEALYDALFTAKRNATGSTSADLFNGFSTIFKDAVTAGKASGTIGNYMDLSGTAVNENNIGDVLTGAFKDLNRTMRRGKVKLYMPTWALDMYETWFQLEFGHAPWNDKYEQYTLHSSRKRCEFVALDNMDDQDYMFFSVKENMNIGFDQESDKEDVKIRIPDNPKLVQLFMKTHFGTGFETIMPEYLCGVKIAKA